MNFRIPTVRRTTNFKRVAGHFSSFIALFHICVRLRDNDSSIIFFSTLIWHKNQLCNQDYDYRKISQKTLLFPEFRLADFKVLVAETYIPGQLSSSDVTMCYSQEHSLGPGEIKDVRCNQQTIGRYVIITKNNPKRSPLTLCEVEVFGSIPRGIKIG